MANFDEKTNASFNALVELVNEVDPVNGNKCFSLCIKETHDGWEIQTKIMIGQCMRVTKLFFSPEGEFEGTHSDAYWKKLFEVLPLMCLKELDLSTVFPYELNTSTFVFPNRDMDIYLSFSLMPETFTRCPSVRFWRKCDHCMIWMPIQDLDDKNGEDDLLCKGCSEKSEKENEERERERETKRIRAAHVRVMRAIVNLANAPKEGEEGFFRSPSQTKLIANMSFY